MNKIADFRKQCPECDIFLKPSSSRCTCGWKESAKEKIFSCEVIESYKPCGATQNVLNVGTDSKPIFWCHAHYDQRRKKSSIEIEIDRRAKMFADAAKGAQMTNQEFCTDHLKHMGIKMTAKSPAVEKGIQNIKNILLKQNSAYAVMEERK